MTESSAIRYDPAYFRNGIVQDASSTKGIVLPYATTANKGILTGASSVDSDISSLFGAGHYISVSANQSAANAILVGTEAYASGPHLIACKTRTSTLGNANTILNDADELFAIYCYGADGANFIQGATLQAKTSGTPASNSMGSAWVFGTTAQGGTSSLERWRIDHTGALINEATNGGDIKYRTTTFNIIAGVGTAQRIFICGGNSNSASSGALLAVNGATGPTAGFATLSACDATAGAKLQLTANNATGSIELQTAGSVRISVNNAGDLSQDPTNGGSIAYNQKQNTSISLCYQTNIATAGTDLATATQLTAVHSQLTTVNASQGVKLWNAAVGSFLFVHNNGGSSTRIYPPDASSSINANGNGVYVTIPSGYSMFFVRFSTTKWHGFVAIQSS